MGCTMAKCRNCHVEILDVSEYCPLCRSVLEAGEPVENMYPNERVVLRKRHLFSRIYLFLAIVAEIILVGINTAVHAQIYWSVITGLALFYSYLVLRYAVIGQSGYRSKTVVLILMGVLSAVAVDFVIGSRGWSVDFLVPAGILFMDLSILLCIGINRRAWQSYIIWLLLTLLFAMIPAALYLLGLEKHWHLAFMPLIVTAVILLGVLIIGGRRSTDELRRRFHL